MASATKIIQGTKVPVCLQIESGDTTKFPIAIIKNDVGTTITVLNLTHLTDGLYVPTSEYLMPKISFIKVVYIVYDDALRTVLSSGLGRDLDVFVSDNAILDIVTKTLEDLRAVEFEISVEEQDEIFMSVINQDDGEININVESDEDEIEILVEDNGEVSIDIIVEDAGMIEIETPV